jgi:hypothetical protein
MRKLRNCLLVISGLFMAIPAFWVNAQDVAVTGDILIPPGQWIPLRYVMDKPGWVGLEFVNPLREIAFLPQEKGFPSSRYGFCRCVFSQDRSEI